MLCAIFWVVFLGALCRFYGFSIFRLLAYIKEELWITLGAASNEPAMPGMLMKMEKLGCDRSVVGLTIPAAYAFNLDGTAIYLSFATMYIAQACNIHLSWGRIFLMLLIMLIFQKSENLAAAYGLAVTGTMTLTGGNSWVIPQNGTVAVTQGFLYRVWLDLHGDIRADGWGVFGGSGAISQAQVRFVQFDWGIDPA